MTSNFDYYYQTLNGSKIKYDKSTQSIGVNSEENRLVTDASYRLVQPLKVDSDETINIYYHRTFVIRNDYQDYGNIKLLIESASAEWGGRRSIIIYGKLKPGGEVSLTKITIK